MMRWGIKTRGERGAGLASSGVALWLAVALSMAVVAGCEDDGPEPEGVDCGAGELVEVEGESFCVFEAAVVIENGFRCPADFSTLTSFGPVGICSAGPLERGRREAVARAHRSRNPQLWAEAECVGDSDCGEGEQCEDAACEGGGEPECPEGQERVGSAAECLQDDAVCEEIAPGVFCTGPDAPQPPQCPEGQTQVGSAAECFQDDAVCEEIAPGVFCTGPDAPECPEGFEPTDECEVENQDCFRFSESLLCRRVEAANCCCEFLVEGDILEEDLLTVDECAARDSGQCIEVDPNRLTPHPCCPDAQGERCGGD